MKKEKFTPEQMRSNLCDPDFIREDGTLIFTSSKGKIKRFDGIDVLYRFEKYYIKASLSISFLKSRDIIASADYDMSIYQKVNSTGYNIRESSLDGKHSSFLSLKAENNLLST